MLLQIFPPIVRPKPSARPEADSIIFIVLAVCAISICVVGLWGSLRNSSSGEPSLPLSKEQLALLEERRKKHEKWLERQRFGDSG